MSDIKFTDYVISDTHLGHSNILGFCRPWFKDIQEHDDHIIQKINETVPREAMLWILGDVAFNRDGLMRLREVKCRLGLIGGNHDHFNGDTYLRVFDKIKGVATLNRPEYSILFTHIPMHPDQMRWKYNIHGHLHTYHVGDDRYINVSCEPMDFTPKTVESLIKLKEEVNE